MRQVKNSYSTLELSVYYYTHHDPAVELNVFLRRVQKSGLALECAITAPLRKHGGLAAKCTEYFNQHQKELRAVVYDTFYLRVARGWAMDLAICTPVQTNHTTLRNYYEEHPKPQVAYSVFYSRVVCLKWDPARAITQPSRHITSQNRDSPEHVFYATNKERAKVDFNVFYRRVVTQKINMETALTTEKKSPRNVDSELSIYYKGHPNPKVMYKTFASRVKLLRWDKEEVITTASNHHLTSSKAMTRKPPIRAIPNPRTLLRKELEAYYELHEHRAVVQFDTFLSRVRDYQWDRIKALTTQVKGVERNLPYDHRALQNAFMSMRLVQVQSQTAQST